MGNATDFEFIRLHHVQLAIPAGVEDACRAFWGETLGMIELEKPPMLAVRGGCWFRAGDLEIHLGVVPDFRPARKAHPGILVKDVSALAVRLEAHGIAVEWDESIPDVSRFHTADPFGNRLEFMELPAR